MADTHGTEESVRNRAQYAHLIPAQQADFLRVIGHDKPAYGQEDPTPWTVCQLPAHPVDGVVPVPEVYARLLVDNPAVQRFDFLVALDTEYVAWEDAKGPFNWFLSAQYAVLHQDRYAEGVWYSEVTPSQDNRRIFGQYLNIALRQFGYSTRKLQEWCPSVLVLCHRSIATWALFKDRKGFYDAWRRDRNGQPKKHSGLVEIDGSFFSKYALTYPYPLDNQKHYGKVRLTWRDTARLAVDGTDMDKLAALTPIPKISLCADQAVEWALKENLHLIRHGNPALFEHYAVTDCRVILAYALRYYQQAHAVLGCDRAAPTVSGTAESGFLQHLKDAGKDYHALYGLTQVRTRRNGQTRTTPKPTGVREVTEKLAVDCYMGGMNQSYRLGEVQDPDSLIFDIDLTSAYGGIMGTLPAIDWFNYQTTAQRVTTEDIRELYHPENVGVCSGYGCMVSTTCTRTC
jgi:hypothetical protein